MLELIAFAAIFLLFMVFRYYFYLHLFKKKGEKKPRKKVITLLILVGIAKLISEMIF